MKSSTQVFAIVIILLFTWLTYSNHFNNDFHFDDIHTIVHNEYIRDIKNLPLFFTDATTTSTLPTNQAYRPGLTALNTIDMFVSGDKLPQPFTFHVSIFLSYLILGVLVYLMVLHLLSLKTRDSLTHPVALFTTAWFLLHAANGETINYIIARSDSFSTLAIVLSFTIYMYFPTSRKWHLYVLPALAGFFVKEQTLMFLPILFVYRMLFEEHLSFAGLWKERKRVAAVLKSLLLPFIGMCFLFFLSRALTPSSWNPGELNTWEYLFTQPFVIFHYLYNFILPVNLVVDTDWKVISSYFDDRVLAGLLFVFALLFIAFKASGNKDYKLVSFGICWFLIALLPTSSIFPFAEVLNDHRTFFPYIGLFIVGAGLVKALLSSEFYSRNKSLRIIFPTLALIFLVLHATGTYHRNEVWDSEETLWKEATIKAPRNERAWMNYGLALMAKGNYQDAELCYLKAMEIAPNYPYVYINLGIVKSKTGRPAEAEEDFKKALSLGPNIPECYSLYGRYLLETGRPSEAKQLLEKGLILSPQHELLKQLYATALQTPAELKPSDRLRVASQAALKNPTAENFITLSLEYYNAALYDSCIVAATQALKIRPEYDLAYNNICAAYNRLKMWDKAILAGEKGLKINPENQLLMGNLRESHKEKSQQ